MKENTPRKHPGEAGSLILAPWLQARLDASHGPRRAPLPRWLQARLDAPPTYGGQTLHDTWQPEEWAFQAWREEHAERGRVYREAVTSWLQSQAKHKREKMPFDRPFPPPPSGRKPRAERRRGDGSVMFPPEPDKALEKVGNSNRDAAILAASKGGQTQRQLAVTFGLSQSRINQIIKAGKSTGRTHDQP